MTIPNTATGTFSSNLLLRVLDREPDAWERLARLYGPLVYRWARQSGLQDDDAADVVQEVFRGVESGIGRYDRAQSFRGWLWGITRNKLREFFRRTGGKPAAIGGTDAYLQMQQVPEQPVIDPDTVTGFDTQASLLHRTLELIRPDYEEQTWQAFWQTTIDARSAPQVAEEFGISTAAVRQAKYRVLTRLRKELEGQVGA